MEEENEMIEILIHLMKDYFVIYSLDHI